MYTYTLYVQHTVNQYIESLDGKNFPCLYNTDFIQSRTPVSEEDKFEHKSTVSIFVNFLLWIYCKI